MYNSLYILYISVYLYIYIKLQAAYYHFCLNHNSYVVLSFLEGREYCLAFYTLFVWKECLIFIVT